MKNYELTFLISSSLSEDAIKDFIKEINSLIQEEGGILKELKETAKRILSYVDKKQTTSYMVVLNFQSDPEKIKDIERKLKEKRQILRYMLSVKKSGAETETPKRRSRKPSAEKGEISELRSEEEKTEEKKVELKDIEKKLEEILGEE